MEREQTTIRLPAELKELLQQEAEKWADKKTSQPEIRKNLIKAYMHFATKELSSPKCNSQFVRRIYTLYNNHLDE